MRVKKLVGIVASCVVAMAVASMTAGCGAGSIAPAQPATCTSTTCSLSISGPASVPAGTTVTYVATETAPTADTVTWRVNGVAGGAAATGTITAGGAYTAPGTTQSLAVEIDATTSLGLSAKFPITVTPLPLPPTVTLSASPASVAAGASSTLTWSTTNATTCTAGGAWNGSQAISGTAPVTPSAPSSTYTLTCTGAGGQGQASTTVNVVAAPTVTLSAAPTSVAAGASSTLTWSTTNATSCTASGAWTGPQSVSGTATVLPSAPSSTYTLTCTGTGGQGQASTTVKVVAPPTVTLTPSTAAGVPILPTGAGDYDVQPLTNIDLVWTSTNATACSASWTTNTATSGTAQVRTANTYNLASATYTITCAGILPGTSATASLPLSIWAAVTATLSSSSTNLAPGDSATLTWSSRFANACTVTGVAGTLVGGTTVVTPLQTTTYTVQCTGPAGSTASASTTLNVGASPAPGVQLSAVPTIVLTGEPSTLTWTSTHATSCAASTGFSTGQQANGTAAVSPTAATTYTITCTGPSGTATASAKVAVTSEPAFPPVCATVPAQVQVLLPQEEINASLDTVSEVQRETQLITNAFTGCAAGSAVELTAGANGATGFLLAPLTVPAGISLIIDGGITVFGTSNVDLYYPSTGSLSLINLGDKSGLYGYGVVDGRGYSTMIGGSNPGSAWWDRSMTAQPRRTAFPPDPSWSRPGALRPSTR